MKNLSLLALVGLMMTAFSFKSISQDSPSAVVITITTSSMDKTPSEIIVVNEEGKVSKITLRTTGFDKNYTENITHNAVLIQKELNTWLSKGYKVASSVSEMDRQIMIILTKQ